MIFGIQPPPSFDVAEDYWGYRSLEKTIMDLRGIVSSRDFGVALKGKLNSGGTINYCLMYGNGITVDTETDRYKRSYAHIDLKPSENIDITVYGDYRFKADKTFSSLPEESFRNDALTTDIFVGYKIPKTFLSVLNHFYRTQLMMLFNLIMMFIKYQIVMLSEYHYSDGTDFQNYLQE
ncbi:MAG: hypothetical protein M5T52_05070 [Ignavibacteriaceae bacterium]|nr:hypothetical protein [Ignavibacteriaceae bacterium]